MRVDRRAQAPDRGGGRAVLPAARGRVGDQGRHASPRLRRRDGGDARIGGRLRPHAAGVVGVGDQDQRAVDPGSEAAGDEVVGAALGAGGGEVAFVGESQPQVEGRRREREQQGRRADGVRHRVARHVIAPALPARAARRGPPTDPRAGEREERREQRDRGQHHDQDDDRDADAGRGQERDAGDDQAEDRDDHRAAGEHDGAPRGRDRACRRLLDHQSLREVLAVAGHEQQGVVDADAEPDHAGQLWGEAGDRDQVGDQRHRADPEHEPEDRHADRQSHRDHRSERHEQDHDRRDEADQLADPEPGILERVEQVAAELDLERRSGTLVRGERLQATEVGEAQILDHRILDADDAHAAVGRDLAAGVEDVGERFRTRLQRGEVGVAQRGARDPRRHDDLCREAGACRPGGAERIAGLRRVGPGHVERVLQLAAEPRRGGDHEHGDGEPCADGGVRTAGREAAEAIERRGHGGDRRGAWSP